MCEGEDISYSLFLEIDKRKIKFLPFVYIFCSSRTVGVRPNYVLGSELLGYDWIN